ncbi:MAG: glutathione binding-like protein, partial [Caulobacteraceae bacterium]|nr:glutathione binding-like protein [Caulobacteraceae bacterium]
AALARLEVGLEGRDYLASDRLSLADVALVAYTRLAGEGGFDLAPYPNLHAWIQRVEGALAIA